MDNLKLTIKNNDRDYVRYRNVLFMFVLRLMHQFVKLLEFLAFISVLSFAQIFLIVTLEKKLGFFPL